MADAATPRLPLFPIQLVKVDIGEISYSCGRFSDSEITPTKKFDLNVAVAPLDSGSKTLQVVLMFSSIMSPNDTSFLHPYSLVIKVHGQFLVVDESRLPFPLSDIVKWAEKNAVIIMLPFLRESVYTITQKTGFAPLMIPMVEVTAFRVGAPNHAQAVPVLTRASPPLPSGLSSRPQSVDVAD